MSNKEIPLKIEVLAQDDEYDFIINDQKGVLAILRDIVAQHNRVALYYDDDNKMVLTLLLAVDESGIWVDGAPLPQDNRHIEKSSRIVFVSTQNQAKVQWVSTQTTQGLYQNKPAFFLPIPTKLLRLQRRDFYRLLTKETHGLHCIIRPTPSKSHVKHKVTIMDISIGGIALTCEEENVELEPGMTYPDCEIDLPDIGEITCTIQVKNTFEITHRNGEITRRAGCVFVKPNGETTRLLQLYVAQMQQQARQKDANTEE